MAKTFYEWLLQQCDRDDMIGDLANDVKKDRRVPKHAKTLDEWQLHLGATGACFSALEALEQAFDEYGHSNN